MANKPEATKPELTPFEQQAQEVRLELEMLQLEELRESSAKRQSLRAQKKQSREATEASLEDSRLQQKIREDACPHRKGGKDMEGLFVGNSGDHSVIKHTLPQGGVMVLCQRCMKEWHRPSPTMIDESTGERITPAAYKLALVEYQKALNLPTDNVPSGTQLFSIRAA